jgi:glucose/arabinose dehydrogenase
VTDFADLGAHVPVRVKIAAPAATPVSVGASTLRIVEHDCTVHTVYLPAVSLAAGATQYLWVTSSGSTYVGAAADAAPVFGTLARGTDSPYEVREPGFVVERFATGLQLPTNIAFVPNPGPNPTDVLMYVTELYGQIKMITRDGTVSTYASGLLNFNPTGAFPGSGEVGLAGITVEPATGDLFCTLLYQFDTSTSPLRPKIIRLHSSDGGRTMATSTLVRDFPTEPQGQSHQISSITIGPDGKLYVHMGDGFTAANALDLNSARGKILRMNLDGSIPSDNPRYNAADGLTATDLIWCYGLRNPFGGCWRTSDGQHFTVENGPSVDRLSRSVANTSYGYTGSDASMAINALYNWNPAHAPVNIAFQQLSTFGGSGFPAATLDQAFVTESGPTYGSGPQLLGKRIVHFALAPSTGTVQSGPATLLEYTGVGQGSCVGLAFGPDGLYFTDLYKDLNAATPIDRGANVWRVRYVGPNAGCAVCAADYNGVNGVDLLDIFAFLNDWFAMNPRADFNGQNGVDLIDIFAFLTAWFTGC